MTTEKATFGAGCFWGVEATFRAIKGVTNTTVGYTGGTTKNPAYEDVCSHTIGHADVVQVEFDPVIVTYKQLLDVFLSNHNPTSRNQQSPDIGDQSLPVISDHTSDQRA